MRRMLGLVLVGAAVCLSGAAALLAGEPDEAPELEPMAAIECGANDDVKAEAKAITGAVAISIGGACDVELKGSTVEGTETGIEIGGSGDLEMEGGAVRGKVALAVSGAADVELDGVTIEGTEAAIQISGNGELTLKNCTVKGEIVKSGMGEVKDAGGNTFTK